MNTNVGTIYRSGIKVNNYSFGFSGGRYYNPIYEFTPYFCISKLEDDGMTSFGIPLLEQRESSFSLMERASRMKYNVNTNDLARMATNFLVAFEIDRDLYERNNGLVIEQPEFHSDRGLVPSPLLYGYWGGRKELRDPGSHGLAFEVSAVSGQLLELNMGNASGCKGLSLVNEKDINKLLSIPDKEFQKYSDIERSNLVISYSTYVTPEMIPALTNLNYWFPQTNLRTAKDFTKDINISK